MEGQLRDWVAWLVNTAAHGVVVLIRAKASFVGSPSL